MATLGYVTSHLIPCPVCGQELHVEPGPGPCLVDCPDRHRARTDPDLYEFLRRATVVEDIGRHMAEWGMSVARLDEAEECCGHDWVVIEALPDLEMLTCRRCLGVAVAAG